MADIIRIKRRVSGAPGAPASLANAELAYNEADHTLYYGEGTGGAGGTATVVVPIGGAGIASNANPLMDGTAVPGTSGTLSRGDHVHPVDTSRYAASNPAGYQTAAQVLANPLNSFALPTGPVNFNNQALQNLAPPSNQNDAATKGYVDGASQGLVSKAAVQVATTGANITLSGLQTIDGYTTVAGDRVLVKDQTAQANNGIYIAAAGAWARATDMDTWPEVPNAYVFVSNGTSNQNSSWVCTSVMAGGVLGSTPITWVQFSKAETISAGNGLNKVGSVLNVVGTAGQILVGAAVGIDPSYAGQASIVTVGTIATGTWHGAPISPAYGGTGAANLTGYVVGHGASAMTASTTIPNTDVSGLGTMSTQNAYAVVITGGTIDNIVIDGGVF